MTFLDLVLCEENPNRAATETRHADLLTLRAGVVELERDAALAAAQQHRVAALYYLPSVSISVN